MLTLHLQLAAHCRQQQADSNTCTSLTEQPPPHTQPPTQTQLDPQLATAARTAVAAAGLSDRVTILQGDAAAADLSGASVVAVYLSEAGNRELLAAVSGSLPRGARVVSHYFGVAGWERQLRARDASAGIELYLYEAP